MFVKLKDGRIARLVTRGNQQPAVEGTVAERKSGIQWTRAVEDGSLVNLDLAQQIQVYDVDGVFQVICSYNDGGEVVVSKFGVNEDAAWKALDEIAARLGAD